MYKLHENIIEFYKEKPEMLQVRLKLHEDCFRDQIEDFPEEKQKELLEKFYDMMGECVKNWIFPDLEDYHKLF